MTQSSFNTGRLIVGLAMVALGALFLLDQTNALDAGSVISRWWPLILITIGLVQLLVNPHAYVGPTIITLIGLVLLGSTLDLYTVNVWNLIWPAVIIIIGVSILLGRTNRFGATERMDTDDRVRTFSIFSGTDVVSHAENFTSADMTAIFGGGTLDLRRARIAPEGAVVDVTAAFGGVAVIVPYGCEVVTNGLPIFGGFDNKTANDEVPEGAPKILVRGTVIFGGVEVKHDK